MAKMTIRIILKSGVEFAIKCDKFDITQNGFGQITQWKAEGITESKPIFLDTEQVAAIVRKISDEEEEPAPEMPEIEKKPAAKEIKANCPFCEGENKNARIYADDISKEYFVYCPVCGIETAETYTSKAKALKAFSEGKTTKIAPKDN